jgi:hypothetical protein
LGCGASHSHRRILGVWHGHEGKQRSDLRGKARTNLAGPLVVGWSSHHGRSWRRPRGTDTVALPTKVLPTNALLVFIALLASLLVTVVLLFNEALPLVTILHHQGASWRRHKATARGRQSESVSGHHQGKQDAWHYLLRHVLLRGQIGGGGGARGRPADLGAVSWAGLGVPSSPVSGGNN